MIVFYLVLFLSCLSGAAHARPSDYYPANNNTAQQQQYQQQYQQQMFNLQNYQQEQRQQEQRQQEQRQQEQRQQEQYQQERRQWLQAEEEKALSRQGQTGANPPQGQSAQTAQPAANRWRPGEHPVFVDFKDTFSDSVMDYIHDKSKKNSGVFTVKDDLTGQLHVLKLLRVRKDKVTQVSSTQALGCAEFEGVNGMETVDLDFTLTKEAWQWGVSKVLVHKVDGKARYVYSSDNEVVRVGSKTPAPAEAPAVPKPKAPAALAVRAEFHEPSGNGSLDGGEEGALAVTVTNGGKGTAYDVHLVPGFYPPVPGLETPAPIELGNLKPGESRTAEVALKAGSDVASRKVRLTVEVKEGNGFDAEPLLVEFETRTFRPARLEVSKVLLASGQVVKAGEPTRVKVAVRNAGQGAALAVTAALVLESPDIFMSDEPSVGLGDLGPGESKEAEFEFFVNKRIPSGQALPISVTLSESKGAFGADRSPLNLVLGKAPAGTLLAVKSQGPEPENVDLPPEVKTRPDPDSYAVVIGIERYRDLPAVDFASRDAQAVYDYLTKAMGYEARNVVLLQNDRATLTDLSTYLGPWLKDRVEAKSRVFVYFSGHGAPDPRTGEGYLIPFDGNPSYAETKAFSVKQLYDGLAQLPSMDVTVALDSCFSGAGGRSVMVAGARPLIMMAKAPSVGDNTVALTASSSDQISVAFPAARHGLLTYYLLKGLRGAAADREGRVTTAGLYDFLRPAVKKEARRQHVEQVPTLMPPPESLGQKGSRVWLKLK